MSQFKYLFGTTRIPELGKDRLYNDPNCHHIVVLRRGHIYSFDLLNNDGTIRKPREIGSCVNSILQDPRPVNNCPVGVLTASNRDEWTKTRQHLVNLGNEEVLKKIDSATFILALDDYIIKTDYNKLAREFLHSDATNRWFDKSFTLFVSGDGYTGMNIEHSWGDGLTWLGYTEVYSDKYNNLGDFRYY